jgi:hypothetical protein
MVSLPIDNMLIMAYLCSAASRPAPDAQLAFMEATRPRRGSTAGGAPRGGHRLIRPRRARSARQCFVSVEGDERSLPPLVDVIGEDVLFWASDFRTDGHFPAR